MSFRKRVIRRHMRRIVRRAMRRRAVRRIVRKGRRVKHINFAKPRSGSIMLA